MTGIDGLTGDLPPERRRLLYRAWHRGTREMDLLLGEFANAHIREWNEEQFRCFETLLEVSDPILSDWIQGLALVPDMYDTDIFRDLQSMKIKPHAH